MPSAYATESSIRSRCKRNDRPQHSALTSHDLRVSCVFLRYAGYRFIALSLPLRIDRGTRHAGVASLRCARPPESQGAPQLLPDLDAAVVCSMHVSAATDGGRDVSVPGKCSLPRLCFQGCKRLVKSGRIVALFGKRALNIMRGGRVLCARFGLPMQRCC